jgi:hypothetical protein
VSAAHAERRVGGFLEAREWFSDAAAAGTANNHTAQEAIAKRMVVKVGDMGTPYR